MIKLVVSDIDGTLIGGDEKLPTEAIKLKEDLEKKGIYFSLATGRVEEMASYYVEKLNLTIPYVATNGATVVLKDNYLRHLTIPVNPLREFIYKADKLGMSIVYSINGHEFYWNDTRYLKTHREKFDRYHEKRQFTEEEWNKLWIDKLSIFTDIEDDVAISSLEKDALSLGSNFSYTRYQAHSIELVDSRASKLTGVEVLAKSLGLNMDQVLFCGDHQNDIELIKSAKIGVAVANATYEVKMNADYVCENSLFDGVKEAVYKFCNIRN